jgi:CRISPR system Cascade subunit CasD
VSTLLLRLDGPMQAWGIASRFGTRDTGREPSKSGVIGLLCAALGKPRVEQPDERDAAGLPLPSLTELAALTLGVRVDREGLVLPDFQTVGGGYGKARNADVVSKRFYLADACFLVGLEGPAGLLAALDEALQRPVWQLCLGRKAFPPATPVWLPDGLSDTALYDALADYPWLPGLHAVRGRGTPTEPLRLVIEPEALSSRASDGGAAPARGPWLESVRQDVPLSFNPALRRFTIRRVVTVPIPLGGT